MARVDEVIGYGTHAARPAAGSAGALYYETDTDSLFRDNGLSWDALTIAASGGGGLYSAYLCYQDQETQNTNGGTFTSGAWQTRVLNTEVADTGSDGTLSANQISLAAGTYLVHASAPAYQTNRNQLRLRNITDGATLVTGQPAFSDSGTGSVVAASLVGRFTIGATKTIELQHQCQTTAATFGFGVAANFATEVYASVELWKEA